MTMDVSDKHMASRPRVQASNWEGIVGNDISRISTNVDNLAASFHELVMENKQLLDERDELLEQTRVLESRVKDLTLQLKLLDQDTDRPQAEAADGSA